MEKFRKIHNLLVSSQALPQKNRDHGLSGNWSSFRECHIEPDWLLIYKVNETQKLIEYARMGSHSDLFLKAPELRLSRLLGKLFFCSYVFFPFRQ